MQSQRQRAASKRFASTRAQANQEGGEISAVISLSALSRQDIEGAGMERGVEEVASPIPDAGTLPRPLSATSAGFGSPQGAGAPTGERPIDDSPPGSPTGSDSGRPMTPSMALVLEAERYRQMESAASDARRASSDGRPPAAVNVISPWGDEGGAGAPLPMVVPNIPLAPRSGARGVHSGRRGSVGLVDVGISPRGAPLVSPRGVPLVASSPPTNPLSSELVASSPPTNPLSSELVDPSVIFPERRPGTVDSLIGGYPDSLGERNWMMRHQPSLPLGEITHGVPTDKQYNPFKKPT